MSLSLLSVKKGSPEELPISCWIGVGEAADLLLLIVPQLADTILRCIAVNHW